MNKQINKNSSLAILVPVAGHLLHDLAVDLVPQHLILGGRLKDLVGEVQPTLLLLGGVVTHVLQDGCESQGTTSTTTYMSFDPTWTYFSKQLVHLWPLRSHLASTLFYFIKKKCKMLYRRISVKARQALWLRSGFPSSFFSSGCLIGS